MPLLSPEPGPRPRAVAFYNAVVTSKSRMGLLERVILRTGLFLSTPVVLVLLFQACASRPPGDIDDLCEIFSQKSDWYDGARRSFERWGVPESIQLAVVHQESRFRASARPDWRRVLWLFPAGRLSSSYGYGQVKDGTWLDYVRATGNRGAARDDFVDVVDFIGWYGDVIHRSTAVAKDDAYHLYLGYHEGPGGFARGSHREKPWLLHVARKVEARARLYQSQYLGCRDRLEE